MSHNFKSAGRALAFLLLAIGYGLLATPVAPAQVQDRINRGCGSLGGSLVQVLTDFSGNVLITTCTGKAVYINGAPIGPGGIGGSGTAGTIPLWTGPVTLGDSILTQTGTSAVTLGAGAFNYTQVAAPAVSAANLGKVYFDSTSKTLKASYNAAAYFDLARSNVTAGTVALGGTGGLFGNSYATQSGNNFLITQPATGNITIGSTFGSRPNIVIADTAATITGNFGGVPVLNLDGSAGAGSVVTTLGPASAAQVQTTQANSQVNFGDVAGAGNLTFGRIDDAIGQITLRASSAAGAQFSATGALSVIGDYGGGNNGSTVAVADGAQTITGNLNGAPYLNLDGSGGVGNGVTTLGPASAAQVQTTQANSQVLIGDVVGSGNSVQVRVDDLQRGITLANSFTTLDLNAATTVSALGDVNIAGNGTTFNVKDSTQTFQFDNANYFGCTTLNTDGTGIIGCVLSDAKLKENRAPFRRGLSALSRIHPESYNFIPGRYYNNGARRSGFIANNVQAAIPEAVSETGVGILQVDTTTVLATAVNAINELSVRVQLLEQANARLRRQLRRRHL